MKWGDFTVKASWTSIYLFIYFNFFQKCTIRMGFLM